MGLRRDTLQNSLNEAQLLAKLHHRNLVKGYGSFMEKGVLYILMEYEPNGSLKDVIDV